MRMIKQINELIEKEMKAADCYVQKSIHWKEENPTLSRALYEASLDEMDHAARLHEEVVKLIQAHKEQHGDPPVAMQELYDYLHERHIEYAAEIRGLQGMYKTS